MRSQVINRLLRFDALNGVPPSAAAMMADWGPIWESLLALVGVLGQRGGPLVAAAGRDGQERRLQALHLSLHVLQVGARAAGANACTRSH